MGCESPGVPVVRLREMCVHNFDGGKRREPIVILGRTSARESGKGMIHHREQALLTQVGRKPGKVVTPPLHLSMLPLVDAVDTHMQFSAGRSPAGDLFA